MNNREIDALMAEKVMQWDGKHDINECEDGFYSYCRNSGCFISGFALEGSEKCEGHPPYSSDIAAAWEVMDKMPQPGIYKRGSAWRAHSEVATNAWADAETAPMAICLAALKAVGVEVSI